MSEHKEPIPSMIYNASVGGHVTNSQQIIDENENKEQSQINSEVKQIIGQGGSIDERINKTKTDIIGGASSNGNTLKKIEDRVSPLESAVGSGGSIDTRIATAKAQLIGTATSECDTLGEAETKINANTSAISGEITRAQTAEQLLQEQYNALTQSDIIVGALLASGTKNKIYRVPGTTSYSDYMWNGTQFIKMAEYDNAIDDEPTEGSDNLVKSEGVFNNIANNKILSSYNRFDKTNIIDGKWIRFTDGAILNDPNSFISAFIPVTPGEAIKLANTYAYATFVMYDNSKSVIRFFAADSSDAIIIPNGVSYIRISHNKQYLNTQMVVSGELPSAYMPFGVGSAFVYDYYGKFKLPNDRGLAQTNNPIFSKMLLIPTTYVDGIFGGNLNSGFETSDYIEISYSRGDFQEYYFYNVSNYSAMLIAFYDKYKNVIAYYAGSSIQTDIPLKVVPPENTQYIKYSRRVGTITGLYRMPLTSFEDAVIQIVGNVNTDTNDILWVGTSIPAGATYPHVAAKACGYNCINNSEGQQSLAVREATTRCLMWTVDEYKQTFTYTGETGKTEVTEFEFNRALDKTFERAILPFISGTTLTINDGSTLVSGGVINPDKVKVSALVIDHGYNDYVNINELMADPNNIDWDSRDRSNFIGALNYLLDEVWAINPTLKIVICGYFQNSWGSGSNICKLQSLCSERFNIEIMKAWEYSQINFRIIKGTSGYMDWFNETYNTEYVVPDSNKDAQGNINSRYIYLPDGIHPHSDLTQNCNHRLDAIYSKLLKNII